jgi:FkbM family methyltransferase
LANKTKLLKRRKILAFFSFILGRKYSQPLFEYIHKIALVGMNVSQGSSTSFSGEHELLEKISDLLIEEREITIFDVGANLGQFALEANQVFAGRAKIFSFEPVKETFIELSENTDKNESISIYPFGLSNKNEDLSIFYDSKGSGLASIYKRNIEHHGIDMNLNEVAKFKTLDQFCAEENIQKIDFLKMDVEGHEIKVLEGSKKMLDSGKITFIQFEFGGCNIDSRTFFRDFYVLLKEKYNLYRVLKDGIYPIKRYSEINEIFMNTNYFACLKTVKTKI